MQRYEHGGNVYGEESILLDFSINVNPMGMPPKARQAIVDHIDEFDIYPDCHCRKLRQALADHHGIPADRILCGNGASDLIFRICAWKKARLALVTAPTFSEYERAVRQFGGQVREYLLSPENGFLLTEDFLNSMTKETEIVFLCSPNNPTGRLIPEDLLDRILARAKELGILVVLDECFLPFTKGNTMAGQLCENLLILRAFTKMYGMAGIRLGYLFGIPELLERIAPYGSEWSVSSVAQVAGVAALEEEGWEEKTRCMVQEQREYMVQRLSQMGLNVFPGEGNYLLLQGPDGLHPALKERGILVRSCGNYTGLGDSYVRIGIKQQEENDILLNAIREVLNG